MSIIEPLKYWAEELRKSKKWKHYTEWSNQEFSILSTEITEASDINISRNAIRNIIEKLCNEDLNYQPQTATKDALAKYVGCKNWIEFEKIVYSKSNKYTGNIFWYLLIILLALAALIYFIRDKVDAFENEFLFEIENPEGTVPHTIVCNYDISQVETNNVMIDFGHKSHKGTYLLNELKKENNIIQQCFHYPGLYKVRLLIDDEIVAKQYVKIDSDSWFIFAANAISDTIKIPEAAKVHSFHREKHINFDQILKREVTDKGELHIPERVIRKIPNISENYRTHFKRIQSYGVPVHHNTFECRFKNADFDNEVSCNEAIFILKGNNGEILFQFVEKGCELYSRYHAGADRKVGKTSKLDFLVLDYSEYRTVKIVGKKDLIELWVDKENVASIANKRKFGELHAINIKIKGSPHIDFVRVFDRENNLVFADEFDE